MVRFVVVVVFVCLCSFVFLLIDVFVCYVCDLVSDVV